MTAHNTAPEPNTLDLHRLKVPEAVRRVEIAIRDTLVAGGTTLRVITGRGNHSAGKIPVLKLAIMRVMMDECVYVSYTTDVSTDKNLRHRIPTTVDPHNPGVLIIQFPSS